MSTSSKKRYGPWTAQPQANSADIYLHNQSAAITAQPVLGANTTKGMYRASLICCVNASAGSSGTITLSVSCAGENGSVSNTYTLPPQSAVEQGVQSGDFVISASGTGDITYQVDFSGIGTVGSLDYNIRVLVEQLSNLT